MRRGTLAVAVALYAAAASSTAPLTGAATVAVALPATAALVLATRRRPRPGAPAPGTDPRPTDPRPTGPRLRRTAAAWALLVGLGAAWELAAWLRQPAYDVAAPDHPTLSLLLDPVTGGGPGRFAAWCAWLYVGWRVARR
ncbi:MAG: hypothetical protein AVDCRST_MAG41-3512 [uncultured Corynebacteriales bacterium]|uniref:Uncharacterized protein n=1 Tax=uncultured Mycobacteriales bacterium TaxID=581187 RepID=A0A6J4JJP3_9ACTN|nr:MAG: hypothetical protein AVDCRST_MAG41-3512 [uncultured Corynebacteriales bacterium]